MSTEETQYRAEASGSAQFVANHRAAIPRCTRKLRSWMVEQVDSGLYPGVCWLDHSKTMFRIPWKHAGKSDYKMHEDGALFKAWAEFKGSYLDEEEMNPAYWKTRLRCALNKSPEFSEVRTRNNDSEPYKVYRLVPESEQGQSEAPRCSLRRRVTGIQPLPVRSGLGLKMKFPERRIIPETQEIPMKQSVPEVLRIKEEPEEPSKVKLEEEPLPVSEPYYITVTVGEETPLPYSGVQVPSLSPGLKQEIPESLQMKEEPEEQSQVPVPEPSAVCEEREEPSLRRQRQSEREEREDERSEAQLLSGTETGLPGHTDDIIRVIVGDHEVVMTEVDVDDDYIHVQTSDGNTAVQNSAPDTSDSEEDSDLCSDTDYDDDEDDDEEDDDWEPSCRSVSKGAGLILKHKSAAESSASADNEDATEATAAERKNQRATTQAKEKPFSCSICNRRFRMKAELKRHGAVHTDEKPYTCPVCQNSYRWKWNLQSHMKSHADAKADHKYRYCPVLQRYVQIPSGEKAYTCSLCKNSFHTKSQLVAHHRGHIGEGPYSCSVCEKTFDIKRELRVHVRTHRGHTDTKDALRKKFKCPYCTKKYWQNNDLQNHIRAHTGERPYSCSICEKTFPRKSSLNRHIKAHLDFEQEHE